MPARAAPGRARGPQPVAVAGMTKVEPDGPTKQGSEGPAQQTAFPNTPPIGRLPTGGVRTLSPPKSSTSKAPLIFVVSPQVSACARLIVQFVTLLMLVSQRSLVHSIPSTQSAFVAQLRFTLWQVLKMLAPCWHCASTGGGPMTASAATTAAAIPETPNLLAVSMPDLPIKTAGQRKPVRTFTFISL